MNDTQLLQFIATGAVALFNIILGFFISSVKDSVRESKVADKELADKVHAIETLVVGEYLPRAEFYDRFQLFSDAMFKKLDKIEEKMDKKLDR